MFCLLHSVLVECTEEYKYVRLLLLSSRSSWSNEGKSLTVGFGGVDTFPFYSCQLHFAFQNVSEVIFCIFLRDVYLPLLSPSNFTVLFKHQSRYNFFSTEWTLVYIQTCTADSMLFKKKEVKVRINAPEILTCTLCVGILCGQIYIFSGLDHLGVSG